MELFSAKHEMARQAQFIYVYLNRFRWPFSRRLVYLQRCRSKQRSMPLHAEFNDSDSYSLNRTDLSFSFEDDDVVIPLLLARRTLFSPSSAAKSYFRKKKNASFSLWHLVQATYLK